MTREVPGIASDGVEPSLARARSGAGVQPLKVDELDVVSTRCRLVQRVSEPSPREQERGDILKACSRHGARNVRIFGSVARGQARPGSDIAVLCDLDPDRDLVDLAALRAELTEILGVPVDVSTPRLLKPAILAAALREAVPL